MRTPDRTRGGRVCRHPAKYCRLAVADVTGLTTYLLPPTKYQVRLTCYHPLLPWGQHPFRRLHLQAGEGLRLTRCCRLAIAVVAGVATNMHFSNYLRHPWGRHHGRPHLRAGECGLARISPPFQRRRDRKGRQTNAVPSIIPFVIRAPSLVVELSRARVIKWAKGTVGSQSDSGEGGGEDLAGESAPSPLPRPRNARKET